MLPIFQEYKTEPDFHDRLRTASLLMPLILLLKTLHLDIPYQKVFFKKQALKV